jgi:RNA polymerase sigma-70 factor, ECF subfamily
MSNERRRRFEERMLPHLDAALRLARWLSRSGTEAEDIVQEAYLRAFRSFDGFHGDAAKPWLMAIVRNCHRDSLARRHSGQVVSLDELASNGRELERAVADAAGVETDDPERIALRQDESMRLNGAIARLPLDYREVLVLREIEDLSYREIAAIVGIPMGTVMSRLARARALLRAVWFADEASEAAS